MTMGGPQIADAVAQTRHFRCRGINFSGSNCVTAFMLKLSIESLKEIKNQVEGGFKPLPCRVQVYDYGRKLRFKVFDRDYDIAVEVADLALEDLVDGSYMAEIIEKARTRILARRLRLNVEEADLAGWPEIPLS